MLYQIFSREARLGEDEDLLLSKKELSELLCRTEDGDAEHLTSVESSRIRMLLNCKKHLLEKYLWPDDGSF